MTSLIDPELILFQNQFVTVFHAPIKETTKVYTVVTARGGAGASVLVILPPNDTCAESRILVLAQNRPPIGGESWELPAGAVDDGETGLVAAQRELFEETGVLIHEDFLVPLGNFHSSPTLAKDTVYLYAAVLPADFDINSVVIQEDEIDDYRWIPVSELLEETMTNESFSVTIPSSLMKARKLGLIESLGL